MTNSYLTIQIMKKKLELLFTGLDQPRDEFLSGFRKAVSIFLERDEYKDRELYLYLKEITKNIYDHNGGYGFAHLEIVSKQNLKITIGNSEPLSATPQKSRRLNYGVGLPTLRSATKDQGPNLEIQCDTPKPYCYAITYILQD